MIAKQLERVLAEVATNTDLSRRSPADLVQRFQSLRGFRLLPRGRGKNAEHLSQTQVIAGILSIATAKPGFAGTVSKVLMGLRPVGGIDASFERCETFGKALETVLHNADALTSLIEVRVSDSEVYTNSHCRATIEFLADGSKKSAYYVGRTAVSLLQRGAEKNFNPRSLMSSIITETVFYPIFFRRIVQELERRWPEEIAGVSVIDADEQDEEKKQEERARRLGLTASSRFLNIAVDNQVTWPNEETVVDFEGHKLILLPKTRDHTTSVHIDLHGEKLSLEDAKTLINRFLSILTWCDDQFAVLQEGWAGNPVPIPVPKRDLAFTTAYDWIFDRKIPNSSEARKSIAIYRDARNAQQNYQVCWAVLSYYKIIELRYKGRADARTWFRDNYKLLKRGQDLAENVNQFEAARGNEEPEHYLYTACRTAVAHANKPFSSDPDDVKELRRLHIAADILRALARLFIQNELGVSECVYDGT